MNSRGAPSGKQTIYEENTVRSTVSTNISEACSSPKSSYPPNTTLHPSNVVPALAYGVDAFFLCTGLMFHVYEESEAQAQLNLARQYIEEVGENWSQPLDKSSLLAESSFSLCSVCIMAALGLQYTKDPIAALDFQPSGGNGIHQYVSIFYHVAKQHLDDLIERNSLEAMKACAAFCAFNTIGHATVALNYACMSPYPH